MFVIQNFVPVEGVAALSYACGVNGQCAIDDETGDIYSKFGNTWEKVAVGTGNPEKVLIAGEVTIRNMAGTVSRTLTAVNGIATLGPSDTIVTNDDVLTVKNSAGSVAENATLSVSGGMVDHIQLRDESVAFVANQDLYHADMIDPKTGQLDKSILVQGSVIVSGGSVQRIEVDPVDTEIGNL